MGMICAEEELLSRIDWKSVAKLAGCYTLNFNYPTEVEWKEYFTVAVKLSEIDFSKMYAPPQPLVITDVLIESDDRFPHKCPSCGGPAYIGLMNTECKGGCDGKDS